jgi:hypothetical protein
MEEYLERERQEAELEEMIAANHSDTGEAFHLCNSMRGAIQFLSNSITEYAAPGGQDQELGDSDSDP